MICCYIIRGIKEIISRSNENQLAAKVVGIIYDILRISEQLSDYLMI